MISKLKFYRFFTIMFVIFFFMSCGASKAFVDPPEIPSSGGNESKDEFPKVNIRYFVKRTETMGSFVQKENPSRKGVAIPNEDSEYIKAIEDIWRAGEQLEKITNYTFYDYGHTSIYELSDPDIFKNESKKIGFYGEARYISNNFKNVQLSEDNGWGNFGSITNFLFADNNSKYYPYYKQDPIKEQDEGRGKLYIIISDLLEGGKNLYNVYSDFFENSFNNGLSTAIFAVNSHCYGNYYRENIHEPKPVRTQNLKANGTSTFYVLIAGTKSELIKYCNILGKRFKASNLKFNNSIFLIGDERYGSYKEERHPDTKIKIDGKSVLILNPVNSSIDIKLYQWGENGGREAVKVKSYSSKRNMGILSSLLLDNVDFDNFKYDPKITIEYFSGQGYEKGKPSKFEKSDIQYNSKIRHGDELFKNNNKKEDLSNNQPDISNYIFIGLGDRNLRSGFYHIKYEISPEAIIPQWIKEKDVDSFEELETSIKNGGQQIKTFGLSKKYGALVSAYNNAKKRLVYKDELYFKKL